MKEKKFSPGRFVFWCISYGLIVASLTLLWLAFQATRMESNPGVQAVKLMYEFDSPQMLVDNQGKLQSILTAEEFKRLTVDEELRAVNTYFKFGYSSSRVEVVEWDEGYVLYRLHNDYIDTQVYWVFRYELTEDGKLTNVDEYQVTEPGYTEGFFDHR